MIFGDILVMSVETVYGVHRGKLGYRAHNVPHQWRLSVIPGTSSIDVHHTAPPEIGKRQRPPL